MDDVEDLCLVCICCHCAHVWGKGGDGDELLFLVGFLFQTLHCIALLHCFWRWRRSPCQAMELCCAPCPLMHMVVVVVVVLPLSEAKAKARMALGGDKRGCN